MGVCKKALKPMFKNDKWHILRGDTVKLLCGKDKGQVGTVLKVIRDKKIPQVLVQGLNLVCLWNAHCVVAVHDGYGWEKPVELEAMSLQATCPPPFQFVILSRRFAIPGPYDLYP